MNRVTFPPESGDRADTRGACPAASSVLGRARRLCPAKAVLGRWRFSWLQWLCSVPPGHGGRQTTTQGHVPAAIQRMNLQSTGELPGVNRLNLAIGLPLSHSGDLTTLLGSFMTRPAPNYHKYLTAVSFAEAFGPTQKDYEALIEIRQANDGLTVRHHSNRMLLDVTGAVADIQRVLHVTSWFTSIRRKTGAFYAPDAEPSMIRPFPSRISAVWTTIICRARGLSEVRS